MVQVIGSGTPRGPSTGERLGQALGIALKGGMDMYRQQQQKK